VCVCVFVCVCVYMYKHIYIYTYLLYFLSEIPPVITHHKRIHAKIRRPDLPACVSIGGDDRLLASGYFSLARRAARGASALGRGGGRGKDEVAFAVKSVPVKRASVKSVPVNSVPVKSEEAFPVQEKQVTHTNTRPEQDHKRPHAEPPLSLNNDRRWRGDGAYNASLVRSEERCIAEGEDASPEKSLTVKCVPVNSEDHVIAKGEEGEEAFPVKSVSVKSEDRFVAEGEEGSCSVEGDAGFFVKVASGRVSKLHGMPHSGNLTVDALELWDKLLVSCGDV